MKRKDKKKSKNVTSGLYHLKLMEHVCKKTLLFLIYPYYIMIFESQSSLDMTEEGDKQRKTPDVFALKNVFKEESI